MGRTEFVRALSGLTEAFPCYEPNAYPVGPDAMQAADLLGRMEYSEAVLRSLGEAVGEVDHYSKATVLASAGRRAAGALLEIISAGVGDAEACAILEDVEPVPALASSRDVETAYGLIEDVLRDLLEDARLSAGAAHRREVALGKLERETVVVDADGRVDGIPADVLAASCAQAWCVEFAEDVAGIVEVWTDDPDPEDDSEVARSIRRGAFTSTQIRQAVTRMVMGQGYGSVGAAYDAYQSAAFSWMDAVDETGERADSNDLAVKLLEEGRQVLIAARAWVAYSTAFAALDDRLGRFRPQSSSVGNNRQPRAAED